MSKKPIGLVIKGLIREANLSTEQVATLLGKSKQSVYNDYNRVGMKDDEIGRYAKALNIEKEVIYERVGDSPVIAQSSNYLMEHLANLEEQFKRLLSQLEIKDKQLEVKDQQMAGLQKTVDVLLGKSDVIEDVTCRVLNSLSGQMVA